MDSGVLERVPRSRIFLGCPDRPTDERVTDGGTESEPSSYARRSGRKAGMNDDGERRQSADDGPDGGTESD